jgi:hypothetical protein
MLRPSTMTTRIWVEDKSVFFEHIAHKLRASVPVRGLPRSASITLVRENDFGHGLYSALI